MQMVESGFCLVSRLTRFYNLADRELAQLHVQFTVITDICDINALVMLVLLYQNISKHVISLARVRSLLPVHVTQLAHFWHEILRDTEEYTLRLDT